MTDIYDIKDIILWFPFNIINSLIYVFFIFVLYFLYKYILNKNWEKYIDTVIIQKDFIEKDFTKEIKIFEKKYIDSSKEIFYKNIIALLREILEFNWEKNISKMTFQEIKKLNLDTKLKELIKNIYYKEYKKEIQDNIEVRKQYIKEIKKIIK